MFIPMAVHIYSFMVTDRAKLEEMRVYPLACPLNVVRYLSGDGCGHFTVIVVELDRLWVGFHSYKDVPVIRRDLSYGLFSVVLLEVSLDRIALRQGQRFVPEKQTY